MHLFTILLSLGIIYPQFTEGHSYKSCSCDNHHKKARIKRSIHSDANFEPNQLSPLPGIIISNNKNGKAVPPNHLQWDIGNHGVTVEHGGNDKESEIVGLAGLAHVHALAARARARAAAARIRARARFHRPLLLQSTPEEFLNDGARMNDLQNISPIPDSILSANPVRRKLDPQGSPVPHSSKPSQQTAPSWKKALQLDKQHHHDPSSSQLHPAQSPNENIPIIRGGELTSQRGSPKLQVVPTSHQNFARSVEDYESNQFVPPPVVNYIPQPEIRILNIDNSAEVNQNRKPGFSIIPTNWKPPPDSNLYVQGEYQQTNGQEPILAVLPGKWTDDDGYDTYYYEDYDVIPIAYDIPDEVSPYGRSAEPEEADGDKVPEPFVGIKQQLQGWEENPMIWRPDSQQRAADPSDKRHFHHGHSHTFIHKHVVPVISGHSSEFHSQTNFVKPTGHVPIQHSGFSHSGNQGHDAGFYKHQLPETSGHIQHSSFSDYQGQGENSGFSHHLSHGHSITINNQKTMVVVPPDTHKNVAIAQVTGTNNAVSQSQSSSKAHHGFADNGFAPHNSNFQSAQVSGSNNAVSQSQGSNEAPFVSRESGDVLGEPYLINFPSRSNNIWRTHNDAPQKFVRKRSIDDNSLDNELKGNSKISNKFLNILREQNKFLKKIRDSAEDDKELLFLTEIGSNLLDDLNPHSITKRTVPLLRLIADPNAKLDVPKTLENMGTVARNSFENKRAPMYHLKNLAGSAKDAFLSTLRIVPQDFIIPSRYKIIDRERESVQPSELQISKRGDQEVGAISPSLLPRGRSLRERIRGRQNLPKEPPAQQPETPREPEDPYGYSDTYKKVGSMLKESVRSGQDALAHMGEIYHSTRKALATARHSAPRVLLSSMRIPAVEGHPPLLPHNNKVLMIAPKIIQLKQEAVGSPHYSDNMDDLVGMGHVMDSLGISKPDVREVERRRIVLQPATIGGVLERSRPMVPNLQARSNFVKEVERPTFNKQNLRRYFVLADTLQAETPEENVEETMDALNNAREAVGASSLKDFILQMKNGLSTLFKDKLVEARDKLSESLSTPKGNLNFKKVNGKVSLESGGKDSKTFKFKVDNPFSEDVKNSNPEDNRIVSNNNPTAENENERVGAGLLLPKRLLTPFMGQPSKIERRQFFEELGDTEELSNESEGEEQEDSEANNSEVGAINPILFNKTFQLCDNRSPFEFLAALNATRHANRTNSANGNTSIKDDSSEMWEHKCIYIRTTTMKTPEDSSTYNSAGVESTTKINTEDSDEPDHETKPTTIRSEEEITTKKIEAAAVVENQNTKTDEVGISMKMGKHLLTPFMGKPYTRKEYTYFAPYGDNNYYEEDSDEDEYLENQRDSNPEQLQVLSTKKNKGSSRKIGANKQNNLDDPLEQNFL